MSRQAPGYFLHSRLQRLSKEMDGVIPSEDCNKEREGEAIECRGLLGNRQPMRSPNIELVYPFHPYVW